VAGVTVLMSRQPLSSRRNTRRTGEATRGRVLHQRQRYTDGNGTIVSFELRASSFELELPTSSSDLRASNLQLPAPSSQLRTPGSRAASGKRQGSWRADVLTTLHSVLSAAAAGDFGAEIATRWIGRTHFSRVFNRGMSMLLAAALRAVLSEPFSWDFGTVGLGGHRQF
jgi:hypothetical protein